MNPKSIDIFTETDVFISVQCTIIAAVSSPVKSERKREVVFDWSATLLRSRIGQSDDEVLNDFLCM